MLRLHTARKAPAHSTPSAVCVPQRIALRLAGVLPTRISARCMSSSAEMPTICASALSSSAVPSAHLHMHCASH